MGRTNVHRYILMADCLSSFWKGSWCGGRDYIKVQAKLVFYLEEGNATEVKAELEAYSANETGKQLVREWTEECRDNYVATLVGS